MSTPQKTRLFRRRVSRDKADDVSETLALSQSRTVPFGPVCFIILSPTSFPGCFSERTAAPPILRSGRRHGRHLMAAQGRAWTRSACPPVTPAARQTARASLPLTALIPSRTRWIVSSISVLILVAVVFCVCESLKLRVLHSCSYQNPLLVHPSTPRTPAPPQPVPPGLLSLPRSTGLPAHTGGLSPSHP